MSEIPIDIEAELDTLFQASLKDFISVRKDVVSKLKKSGDKERAALVGAITKPPLSAWAVNQLFWRNATDFEKLLAAGDEIRRIQHRALAGEAPGDALHAAQKHRQRAIEGLLRLAEIILVGDGHAASQGVLKRISTTLEAAAAYGSDQPDPGPGRLRQDLELPGFERLAELAALPPPPLKAATRTAKAAKASREEPDAGELRAARKEIEIAEAELRQRQAEARRADSGVELAEGRSRQTKQELEKLRSQIERLEERTRQAVEALQKARGEAKAARQLEQAAARKVEEARQRLEELGGD